MIEAYTRLSAMIETRTSALLPVQQISVAVDLSVCCSSLACKVQETSHSYYIPFLSLNDAQEASQ